MKRLGIVVIAFGVLCITGCPGKYTGGGWITSVDGVSKANVGFNMHAEDTDGDGFADTAKGQWEYHDHGVGVAFHGVVTFAEDLGGGEGYFGGTYTPQPDTAGPGGSWDSIIYDGGGVDYFDILVYDGVYAGYYNAGVVQGGNITFHPPK